MASSIATTFGALLLGGYCSAILAGVVVVQTVLYIMFFPDDSARIKAMVGAVCMLDGAHTILVCTATWDYLITHYGDEHSMETISISLALTGITTVISTFIVHCFYSHRIYKLGQHRWQFTALITLLSLFRLCCGLVSSVEMIRLKTTTAFFQGKNRIFFVLGLATSCIVDILITGSLTYALRTLQKGQNTSSSNRRVIGAVLMCTFETNAFTSIVAILAMVFWLTMTNTFISVGVQLSLSKVYANSLLATLNTRKQLRYQQQQQCTSVEPPRFRRLSDMSERSRSTCGFSSCAEPPRAPTKLETTVEKSVEVGIDESLSFQRNKRLSTSEFYAI